MLPVHRSNLPLANECLKSLLQNSDLNIICIDDFGNDSDYIQDERITFIHNTIEGRQPLVKIWNQCIKECPTDNVIIASWRQRPTPEHFKTIEEKLNNGYGLVTFDGLHFFGLNKFLTNKIGFFDEGFTKGQYEDTDWFNRLRTNDIAIHVGYIDEQKHINGNQVSSMWLEGANLNEIYYKSKWSETPHNQLIQHSNELNFSDREYFKDLKEIKYKPWSESNLTENLANYYNIFNTHIKTF